MRTFYHRVLTYQCDTNMRTAKLYKSLLSPFGTPLLLLLFLTNYAWGQLQIDTLNTPKVINFSTTVANVNNGAPNPGVNAGNITANTPAIGQLDGKAWHFVNDGANVNNAATFPAGTQGGGRNAAFSTAPGGAANNVTGQGWYGFNIGGSNPALGWQPQGGFATPGMVTLRIENATASTITSLDVTYRVLERNNAAGSNRVRFYHSATNAANSYALIGSLDVTSVGGAPAASINVAGTSIAGTTVTVTHASGANSAMSLNDVVFFNNSVTNTNLRNQSGYITAMTATTTTVEIDPAVGATGVHAAGGQFTVAPVVTHNRSTSLNVSIAPGGFYFIRWFLDDTGADEMALDDIVITANPEGLVVTNPGISLVIDFDNTLNGVNNGTFTAPAANISDVSPAVGQLNAASWSFVADGAGAPNDFSSNFIPHGNGQGVSNGVGVTTSGWYAFNVPDETSVDPAATTRTLGWQSNNDFTTPGSVTLRLTNITGNNLLDYRISFKVWERNSSNVSNRVRVFISQTNDGTAGSYVAVGAATTHTSVATQDAIPQWRGTLYAFTARSVIGTLNTAPGQSLFIRFYLDHNSGAGEGDEMALDDISIIPSTTALTSINPNRNIVWSYDGFDYYDNTQIQATFKGVQTLAGIFGTGPVELHGITTNTTNNRFRTTNGFSSLGWAGDWLAGTLDPDSTRNSFYVTPGQDGGGGPAKPTIPITSASQQRSLVNSGMYVEALEAGSIGRRLQTSTGGYAFQYTATSTTNFTPCVTVDANCTSKSPLRLRVSDTGRRDTRSINHIRVEANQGVDMQNRWSHTNNVVFGARGTTVWVGVMLRKNFNNNDPVFVSLHRNANPWDPSSANAIQIGYFGAACNSGGFRHWGVRVNGIVYTNFTTNNRITTAQMINGALAGQPGAGSLEERVFDLLVVRIDFSLNQASAVANVADLSAANAEPGYANQHRVRMYVIRDIARDGDTPNGSIYPVDMSNPSILSNSAFNPAGYATQGENFDLFGNNPANLDVAANIDLEVTGIPNTLDPSFHSVAFVSGGVNAGAFDEFRLGGTFEQAALNSPIVSLIRGLCSANGGSLGAQAYTGGDFGSARCLRTDGTRVPEPATITISGITQAAQATITHSAIPSALTNPNDPREQILRVGDVVTINGVAGMTQINGLTGTIVNRPNNTTTVVNINTTSFTAYTSGGNFARVNDCPGTTNATATNSGLEVYDPASSDIWGSNVSEQTLFNQHGTTVGGAPPHPSFASNNDLLNNVMRAGGNAQLFAGGPLNRTLSGGQYTYQLNTGSGPNDNNYLIGTQSRHSFGPAWIPFYDNSPDKNGYLMSINASYARGKFFDQTVSGLCADTQYEFSIDIVNVLRNQRTITNINPYTFAYLESGTFVATDICDGSVEPGCAQFSRIGSGGSVIGVGSVTRGGTGTTGVTTGTGVGTGGSNVAYSLNPEVDFALNDVPIYTVPISIPNDKQWHRVGLTFVTKANLASAINLSVRNLAPGGMGNDLAIDNVSFRPCGSFSELFNNTTLCSTDPLVGQRGRVYAQIGKAGASYANAVVRLQAWSGVARPIGRLITNVTNTNPAVITLVGANGTYGVPVGAAGGTEVALYDLTGMTIINGTVATVSSKTATTVTLSLDATAAGAYTANTGVLRVRALLDPNITAVSNSAGNTRIDFVVGVTADLEVGMQVTLSGFAGVTCLNGQTGRIIDKDATGIIVNIPFCGGVYAGAATERVDLMYGSDDLDNDGIADENEWRAISFNPYDGGDYTSIAVNDQGAFYQAPCLTAACLGMPATPVAIGRDITEFNVFYSNSSEFRGLFAGNQANLDEESGRCRFIITGFPINCSILPASGGNLSGVKRKEGILLSWKTYQERGDMKYILERADDAQNFHPIADYEAMNIDNYRHLDQAPFIGKNYYRVKILESNGAFTYTNTVSIDWIDGGGVSIYPNPASNEVNITFSDDFSTEQNISVRVLNNMGVLVGNKSYKLRDGDKRLLVQTNDLPDGLYLLEIKVGDLDRIVHKLVVKK